MHFQHHQNLQTYRHGYPERLPGEAIVHPRAQGSGGAHVASPLGAVSGLLVEPEQRLLRLVGVHHHIAAVAAHRQRHRPVVVPLVRHLLHAAPLALVRPAAGGFGGVRRGGGRHGEDGAVAAVARADGDHGVVEVLVRLLGQRRRRILLLRRRLPGPGRAARDFCSASASSRVARGGKRGRASRWAAAARWAQAAAWGGSAGGGGAAWRAARWRRWLTGGGAAVCPVEETISRGGVARGCEEDVGLMGRGVGLSARPSMKRAAGPAAGWAEYRPWSAQFVFGVSLYRLPHFMSCS